MRLEVFHQHILRNKYLHHCGDQHCAQYTLVKASISHGLCTPKVILHAELPRSEVFTMNETKEYFANKSTAPRVLAFVYVKCVLPPTTVQLGMSGQACS